jgi:hypothetical protein
MEVGTGSVKRARVAAVAWALEARRKTHRWLLERCRSIGKLELGLMAMEIGMGIFPSAMA